MPPCIGVRREEKSLWERRVPVTPGVAHQLHRQHGIPVLVQPSPHRAFAAAEFEAAGVNRVQRPSLMLDRIQLRRTTGGEVGGTTSRPFLPFKAPLRVSTAMKCGPCHSTVNGSANAEVKPNRS